MMHPNHTPTPFDLLTAPGAALLVVDLQEKLLKSIEGRDLLLDHALRLVKVARILGVLVLATEQYPQGLGSTVEPLASLIPDRPSKTSFHALGAPGITEALASAGVRHVTLVGIEAHVCIAQTALELRKLGYQTQVPADAVGSRFAIDKEFALRRLEHAEVIVSTTEAVLFEWLEGAAHPRFKEVSALVKERTTG